MGWDRVWTLALVQFGAEDIEIRILIGLGVAFLTLMIVEGLRASFRFRRPKLLSLASARPHGPAPAPSSRNSAPAREPKPVLQPFRARMMSVRAVPKPARPAASSQQAFKPKIRRRT